MSVKEPAFANHLSKRRDMERQREIHLAKIASAKPMLTTQTNLPFGYRFPSINSKKMMHNEG